VRDFSLAEGFKSGGILCVFPGFEAARIEEKIRCSAAGDLFRVSLVFLAICQFLWYAVDGAVSSTPVGGFPRFSSGVMLFFAPNRKKGGVHMVTWEELIQFGLFLVALISLVLQANNKKK